MRGIEKEIRALVSNGFTGRIVLHCHQGSVKQIEKHERFRPRPENGSVELTERERLDWEPVPPEDRPVEDL